MPRETEIAIIDNTIEDLRVMVEESVRYQTEVTPIYSAISKKILEMVDSQEELNVWEPKDLLKLLDLSNKAQIQPIEQLTKLVQSVESLYEKTTLQGKLDQLTEVVNQINAAKEEALVETGNKQDPGNFKNIEDIVLD